MKVEVLKMMFHDLTDLEKLSFTEFLNKDYEDFINFSRMTEYEQKVWVHFYPRPAKALGIYSDKLSGEK